MRQDRNKSRSLETADGGRKAVIQPSILPASLPPCLPFSLPNILLLFLSPSCAQQPIKLLSQRHGSGHAELSHSPAHPVSLTFLHTLDLSANAFQGTLSQGLGKLQQLPHL
ncbi:unnamed protein product [Closterium sp. NIES-64]|nr:unnamed protein product [Closterium sp. NIES-64]